MGHELTDAVTAPWWRRPAYSAYLLGFIALVVVVAQFQIFWKSNDDVAMSFIADGGGQVLTPGPRLALTNIAWGYLVYGLHLLGDPWAYASMTYAGLAISYVALIYAFANSKINHWIAALILLCVYLPTVIYPQHTLVAGFLGFAGIVLLCNAIERGSLTAGYVAGALLVLSSLVRWDETVFVALVASPLYLKYLWMAYGSGRRGAWFVLFAAICAVGVGFLALDYFTFGTGEWGEFADTYRYVMLFTDFGIDRYFVKHHAALQGSGFSLNDLYLFTNFFYCDTQVFTVDRIAALLHHLTWANRIGANLRIYREVKRPLTDPQVVTSLVVLAAFMLMHGRRWRLLASICVLGFLMFVLLMLGRPEITRIYIPALAGLTVIGVLGLELRAQFRCALLAMVVLGFNAGYFVRLHEHNVGLQTLSARVQAETCALPKDTLFVTWGSVYPYTANYRPFGSRSKTCYLNNYAFGEYSLAPFALEHLHRYTGGKDFVPAMLAGQSFDVFANRVNLRMLQRYFLSHYQAHMEFARSPVVSRFRIYRMNIVAQPASGS